MNVQEIQYKLHDQVENVVCFGFILIGHFFQLVIYRLLNKKKEGRNFLCWWSHV